MENKYITENYIIHYNLEKYDDGNNLCFSIEWPNYPSKDHKQTYWFNDNHEFGNEERSRKCSIKIAEWYEKDLWRVEMINSGYNDSKYKDYCVLCDKFLRTLYEKII